MAKTRVINTRFWVDDYISNLDPVEKLVFLYFLTNPATDICGIYELPLKNVALDTGIQKEMIVKILKRFSRDKKIYYMNGWVAIVNFIQHQSLNPSVLAGVKNGLDKAPKSILEKLGTDWVQAVSRQVHFNSNLNTNTNSNTNTNTNTPDTSKIDFDIFWRLYPKHIGKSKAEVLWKKLSEDEQEKAIGDIPNRKMDAKWIEGFIKDPERYIKSKQWEDEIIQPRNKIEVYKNKKSDSMIEKLKARVHHA